MNIFAQIIAFSAFLFFISSVQMKEKKKLVFFQLIANLLYGISYLLLNVKTAFYMNFISVLRCTILYFSKKKKPPIIYLFILIGLIISIGILTYDNLLSIIPIGITILYTVSTWQDNMKVIRYLFVIAGVFWIIYNYSVGAYVAIIGNVFEITSGIVSIIRFNKKQ